MVVSQIRQCRPIQCPGRHSFTRFEYVVCTSRQDPQSARHRVAVAVHPGAAIAPLHIPSFTVRAAESAIHTDTDDGSTDVTAGRPESGGDRDRVSISSPPPRRDTTSRVQCVATRVFLVAAHHSRPAGGARTGFSRCSMHQLAGNVRCPSTPTDRDGASDRKHPMSGRSCGNAP